MLRRGTVLGLVVAIGGALATVTLIVLWSSSPASAPPSPTASPSTAAASPAPTAAPASAVPARTPLPVYFARDGLPPIRGMAPGRPDNERGISGVLARLDALRNAGLADVPAGAVNLFARPSPPVGQSQQTFGLSVRIEGDVAEVEFDISTGWGVSGAAAAHGLLQQLVYTITEDIGLHRAHVKEKGKPNAVIDQLVVDRPLSREDVLGYTPPGSATEVIEAGAAGVTADVADWRGSVDSVAPGLARMVVELRPTGAPRELGTFPRLRARAERITAGGGPEHGKWYVRLDLPEVRWIQPPGEAFHCCPLRPIDRTPLRALSVGPLDDGSPDDRIGIGFAMILDDLRPWRVFTLRDPLRIVVDVGGHPQAVSESVALYAPGAGAEIGRDVAITGLARAFEGTVAWRVSDASGRRVANGFTTASEGVGPLWGAFESRVTLPATLAGAVTLEVYWPSPRDGSEVGLVRVPLRVR